MGHTRPLQDTLYAEMKGRIQETDSSVPRNEAPISITRAPRPGKQYPLFCRKKDSLAEGHEEILLDQNLLADGKPFAASALLPSARMATRLAYSVDVEGAEVYTVYIKDLTNTISYPEAIGNTYSSVYFHTGVEWANDSQTLFYLTLDAAQRPTVCGATRLAQIPRRIRLSSRRG